MFKKYAYKYAHRNKYRNTNIGSTGDEFRLFNSKNTKVGTLVKNTTYNTLILIWVLGSPCMITNTNTREDKSTNTNSKTTNTHHSQPGLDTNTTQIQTQNEEQNLSKPP